MEVTAVERSEYDRSFTFRLTGPGGERYYRVAFETAEALVHELWGPNTRLRSTEIRNGESFTFGSLAISPDATISQEPILREPAIVSVTVAVENNNVVSTRKRHLDLGE